MTCAIKCLPPEQYVPIKSTRIYYCKECKIIRECKKFRKCKLHFKFFNCFCSI